MERAAKRERWKRVGCTNQPRDGFTVSPKRRERNGRRRRSTPMCYDYQVHQLFNPMSQRNWGLLQHPECFGPGASDNQIELLAKVGVHLLPPFCCFWLDFVTCLFTMSHARACAESEASRPVERRGTIEAQTRSSRWVDRISTRRGAEREAQPNL